MVHEPCFTYIAELQEQEKTLDKLIRVKVILNDVYFIKAVLTIVNDRSRLWSWSKIHFKQKKNIF
jgi:hypothetical protein